MSEYTSERRAAAFKNRLSDQDVREIKALIWKRNKIHARIKKAEKALAELRRQYNELELKKIAEDFGRCPKIVSKIHLGLSYRDVK